MNKQDYTTGEALISEEVVKANTIYIELDYLKYVEFGRLIAHPNMTADIYTRLVKIASDPSFKVRYTDDVDYLFESVSEVADILKTRKMSSEDVTVLVSPEFEGAITNIRGFIEECRSSKKLIEDAAEMLLIIDTSSLPKLTYRSKKLLLDFYSGLFDITVSIDPTPLTSDRLKEIDAFFISRLDHFNSRFVADMDDNQLIAKHLICSKTLPLSRLPNLVKGDETLMNKVFANIHAVMSMASKFVFTNPSPCVIDT